MTLKVSEVCELFEINKQQAKELLKTEKLFKRIKGLK